MSRHSIPGGQSLTRLIILVVVCSYGAVMVLQIVSAHVASRSLARAVGFASLTVLLILTIFITSVAAVGWPLKRRLALLLAEGLVAYLPILVLGATWASVAGFFAGAALLLLSGWVAWTVFTAAVAGMLIGGVVGVLVHSDLTWADTTYLTIATLVLGLVVFGLARLSQLIRYIDARRGELAQLAVVRERMRFARDLHDLLGFSLSAITLKAELTKRLVGSNPARARDELAELLDIARQALADVRTVSSGYRNFSLAKEVSSVTTLLGEAGIETQADISTGPLNEKTDTVLATVLREAVANMLRHSTARHCSIEAGTTESSIRLVVSNDGVPRLAATGRVGGGLADLSSQLASIGGSLTARVRDGDWFEVSAEAPHAQVAERPDADGASHQIAGA